MTNFEFLQNYQHLQYGVITNQLKDLGFASLTLTPDGINPDYYPYFNYVLVNKILDNTELKIIESEMHKVKRPVSIYFENKKELKLLVKRVVKKGYKRLFEDSWMFYKRNIIDTPKFNRVKKVTNKKELEIYLRTYNATHKKDDPQNPYGELGDYINIAREAWIKNRNTNKLEYFVVYKNKRPVAVSALTNFGKVGYISQVGSLREVRGLGFGKIASLYCVAKSKENKNEVHCLITEEGQYPNEFYKRIGFETKFKAAGYVRE